MKNTIPTALCRALAGVWFAFTATTYVLGESPAHSMALTEAERSLVDEAVRAIMKRDDVPAVSLAIVRQGRLAYEKSYGMAELPGATRDGRSAKTSTRFAIGSVSKEFTAAAILVLADRGDLSLDDTVDRYLPELTDSKRVTIRELLSHTSGYRDYFFQEYIPARMQRPTSVEGILRGWAERPLDFAPGTEWQYSSTNYVIAGRIVEKITGQPYERFLEEHVLRPVGITDVEFADHPKQPERNAAGYYRFALGPARPSPATGRNWLFAMADLEMTAKDVALWDISVLNQSLLSPASYQAMMSDPKTADGRPTGYGLGFFVRRIAGADGEQHLLLHHPGEISGFRAHNFVLPEMKAAVVILTNAEYSDATDAIAEKLQGLVGVTTAGGTETAAVSPAGSSPGAAGEGNVEKRARGLLLELARGRIDRKELAPDAQETFTPAAIRDIRKTLAACGILERVRLDSMQLRGGAKHYALTLMYERRRLQVAEYDRADGRIEQFLIDDKP